MSSIYTFKYEAGLLTLSLMTVSKASWRSPDGFYVLKSCWQGATLEYLNPVGLKPDRKPHDYAESIK